ncbi:MAG TPA: hypothetical protein VLO10_03090 [Candidatus Deferrimicrobium sp.]|nr:hypothetical protein [Candidatus Deferrimicrobium sp.]
MASSLPGGSGGSTASCLATISNTDLYSYSGLNLATGSAPSTATVPSSCSTTASGASSSGETPTVGAQPLLIVAFVLILVGIAATLLRSPMRYAVAAGAALTAAILVIASNSTTHGAVSDKITALINKSAGSTDLNLQGLGGVGNFFNIHAAVGFTLILIALFLAAAVNAAGWAAGSGLRLAHTRAAPRGAPQWHPEPPPGSASAPPPPSSG